MIKERKNIDIILPCHFFASVNIYALYNLGNIQWEANENFQKRSIRSRCSIKTDKGIKHISVPLKAGKNQQLPIKKVEISYEENWTKNFIHSLISCYSGSPYMDFYLDQFVSCLESKPQYLWDLNLELNQLIIDSLEMEDELTFTKEWIKDYAEDSWDFRAKTPNFELSYQYPQLFKEKGLGFIGELSILDLLFCCGPESQLHLKNMTDQIISKNSLY